VCGTEQELPDLLSDFLLCSFEVLCVFVTMMAGSPIMLLFLPGILWAYYRLTQVCHVSARGAVAAVKRCCSCLQYFRHTSRELKRLDAITMSPLLRFGVVHAALRCPAC
jgi:hypothetical protein